MSRRNELSQRLAFLIRSNPTLLSRYDGSGDHDGFDEPPIFLADAGAALDPIVVLARYYHAIQVSGLINAADSVQIQVSFDGVTWANLGAAITANGVTQLTSGLYRLMKAVLTPVAASTTVGAGGSAVGATSLLVASSSAFSTSGAAKVGPAGPTQDWITYGSKADATHLSTIPASGPGSLLYTHAEGDAVVQAMPPTTRVTLLSMRP